ncbi:hypothetical protein [Streptomyces avermitilis]|uniref:hypothetical protein n=1 Tax=Streptomyces avermitilis TaxID=33903 RepID=UPI0036AC3D48
MDDRLCPQGFLYILHQGIAWQLLPLELELELELELGFGSGRPAELHDSFLSLACRLFCWRRRKKTGS